MKKLGKIAVITIKGNLLVRAAKPKQFNMPVVNEQIKYVGKIVDIIGPADNPYIVINTKNAETKVKIGEQLYLMEEQVNKNNEKAKIHPTKKEFMKYKSSKKKR